MAFSTSLKASALASIAAMGAFALATGSPALADHHGKKAEMSQANIVETAMGTGMHETLVAADHPGTLPNAKDVRRCVKDLRTLITDVVQLVSLQAWTHLLCALLENG